MRRRAIRYSAAGVLAALLSLATGTATAHQFAPALLELKELGDDRVSVRWKQPVVRIIGSNIQPILPINCKGIGKHEVSREGTGMVATWEIECAGGLVGRSVGVDGIASSRADVLLRVKLADGAAWRQVLTADAPSFQIEAAAEQHGVLRGYTVLGAKHILTGWDHLVFVLGLVLLIGSGKPLLWTITAFTFGHSVTLGLAALGFVNVSQAPIEAMIALSIYALAIEIIRAQRGKRTFLQRAPWIVAGAFGLLHGLGFAGALAEVGLPAEEIPLTLFSFNLGIELGQLGFVAGLLALLAGWRALPPLRLPEWSEQIPAYAIGGLGMFWFFERVTGMASLLP